MILLLDNYDSFTFMLQDYLEQLGPSCVTWQHDKCTIDDIEALAPEAIVLSPGPKRPEDAGITMKVIEQFYRSLPLLGICLGHQAIGSFFGAFVSQSEYPVHGKTSFVDHHHDALFQGVPTPFQVMRYHSLIVDLPDNIPLQIIASTQNSGIIMALRHQSLPIYSCQFHPESILTDDGLHILANWMDLVGLTVNHQQVASSE